MRIIQIVLLVVELVIALLAIRSYLLIKNPEIPEDEKPSVGGVKFLATLVVVVAVIFVVFTFAVVA